MGYIGTEKRQGNVPENEPMQWPVPEKQEDPKPVSVPETEKETVPA